MVLPNLIIIGAGGYGREMLAWAEQSVQFGHEWTIKGFIDDNLDALAGKKTRAPVLGRGQDYQPSSGEVFICAMGTPAFKRRCSELIESRGGRFTQLIHRTAVLGHEVELEPGAVLCPYAIISGYNRLGKGVAVNLHSSVDHDAVIDDWTQINCHCDLMGSVVIGKEVFFGSHVAVTPGVNVGDGAFLGAGTMVLRNVEAGAKIAGVPGRRIE